MLPKDTLLKKKLIKDSVMLTIVLAVIAGGAVALAQHGDSVHEESDQKQAELTAMRSEYSAFQEELGSGLEVSQYYDAYVTSHNENPQINREAATGWLAAMREKNLLTNLNVTISPITDVGGSNFPLKSGTVVKSDVKLTFGALTDTNVYNFIETLQRQMPGFVAVQELKVTRAGDITRNILVDLGGQQHKITPLVTAELHFLWLGIKPKPPEASPSPNGLPNGSPNAPPAQR